MCVVSPILILRINISPTVSTMSCSIQNLNARWVWSATTGQEEEQLGGWIEDKGEFFWEHVKSGTRIGDETYKLETFKWCRNVQMSSVIGPHFTCHSYINMTLPISVSLNLAAHILRSAPKLFRTLCWATGRQHLALQTHNSTICPVPVNPVEVTARAQRGKKDTGCFFTYHLCNTRNIFRYGVI